MEDGYKLSQQNPDIYLGEKQALNEDYTNSGFDRGHLNPNGHHAGKQLMMYFIMPSLLLTFLGIEVIVSDRSGDIQHYYVYRQSYKLVLWTLRDLIDLK